MDDSSLGSNQNRSMYKKNSSSLVVASNEAKFISLRKTQFLFNKCETKSVRFLFIAIHNRSVQLNNVDESLEKLESIGFQFVGMNQKEFQSGFFDITLLDFRTLDTMRI